MTSPTSPVPRTHSVARSRGVVHVTLFVGFAAALVSLAFLTRHYFGLWGTTDHAIIGLAVLALVLIHLWQRRRTVRRLLHQLAPSPRSSQRSSGPALSDLILFLLTVNAMVSGIADYVVGHTIYLPVPGPYILQKWHAMAVLASIIYVIVHVVRRRQRLWRSRIT